jgi:hypothetical protein
MSKRLQQIREAVERDGANLEDAYADRSWLLREYDRVASYAELLAGLLGRFAEFERDSMGYCEWCGSGRGQDHASSCLYVEVRAALASNECPSSPIGRGKGLKTPHSAGSTPASGTNNEGSGNESPSEAHRGIAEPDAQSGREGLASGTQARMAVASGSAEAIIHTDHPFRHYDRTCPGCVHETSNQPLRNVLAELNQPLGANLTIIRELVEDGLRHQSGKKPCPHGEDHCNCWQDGAACCACGAAAMTDEEKREQGMETCVHQVGRDVEALIAPARELLVLYDWRPELAEREKSDISLFGKLQSDTKALLREYGERKKAGWIALRAALYSLHVACTKQEGAK